MRYPKIFRVRQHFERPRVLDLETEVFQQLDRLDLRERVQPGQTVAITAGSRGIVNIHRILKAVVDFCRNLGTQPFLVAAMGSHGGGTAEGQRQVLEGYGITEAFCGCPVRTRMETVVVDQTPEGVPVHFARDALEADHVLVVGRVKPHTEQVGEFQSGLMKMLLIGLGKHEGAKVYHRAFMDHPFDHIVRQVARRVMVKGHILAGLGIVENAYDETALLRAVRPEALEAQDKELLALARRWMPRLPFDRADLLLVDELGKEISGCGMDTHVTGRRFHEHEAAADEFPKIKRILVRGLSAQTRGNATGLGKAEFCLTRAVQAMDRSATWINVMTASNPAVGMIPAHYDTDREMLDVALGTIGLVEPPQTKLLWIRNTLQVAEVECSEAYWEAAQGRADLEVLSALRPLPLDAAGHLPETLQSIPVTPPR